MTSSSAKVFFVSDLHLKTLNERNSQLFLQLLQNLPKKKPTHFFLLGDIFDFWVGNHKFFTDRFAPLVEAIRSLKSQNVEILYGEGNHDVHVKRFWEEELGITTFADPQYLQICGQVVRIEHGDLINPLDTTYLKYREFIRRPSMEHLAQILPGGPLHSLGEMASAWSRARSSGARLRDGEKLRAMIRSHALRAYDEKPFDLCVHGHMHVLDDWISDIEQKKFRSINLGSWYNSTPVLELNILAKPPVGNSENSESSASSMEPKTLLLQWHYDVRL